jgi:adenylate kinase
MEHKIKTISEWLDTGSINLFGIPFAGKDTQGRRLAEFFNGPLIGGGDILRAYHDQGEIDRVMAEGGLIPSELYLKILVPYLSKEDFKNGPLILSSVGRKKGEELIIKQATETSNHAIKAVVLFAMDEDEARKRFVASINVKDRGQRADDSREVLENRLAQFRMETKPVIDYYKSLNLLIEIDGSLSRDEVTNYTVDSLYKKATTEAE